MKKALISGTSRGIGRSIATKLLDNDWSVVGLSRSESDIECPNYTHIQIDLGNLKNLSNQLKDLEKTHPDCDAIICNAGMGAFGHLEELSFDKIEEVIHLNFLSHVYLIKIFLPGLKRKKSGNIIGIGSEAALEGKRKGSIYCASKFALRGFMQALREECASDGIGVTLINPGMVNTPFFDPLNFSHGEQQDEFISPEDIAASVFLVTEMRPGTVVDEINLSPQKHKVLFKK